MSDALARRPAPPKPLALQWVFGMNFRMMSGVHSLVDGRRDEIFYAAAHTGVIYDFRSHSQFHLQGHCNAITCCAVSRDKRWIVTADAGPDSLLVIWDSISRSPVRTIFNPHPTGVAALALSDDATRIATVSAPPALAHAASARGRATATVTAIATPGAALDGSGPFTQELCLWEWTLDQDGPIARAPIPTTPDPVIHLCFHPEDPSQLATTGPERVVFWGVTVTEVPVSPDELGATASLSATGALGGAGGAAGGGAGATGSAAGGAAVRRVRGELSFFAPPVSRKQLDAHVAPFTSTAFLPGTATALSSTTDGCVLLWDTNPSAVLEGRLLEKTAMKVVRLIGEDTPTAPVLAPTGSPKRGAAKTSGGAGAGAGAGAGGGGEGAGGVGGAGEGAGADGATADDGVLSSAASSAAEPFKFDERTITWLGVVDAAFAPWGAGAGAGAGGVLASASRTSLGSKAVGGTSGRTSGRRGGRDARAPSASADDGPSSYIVTGGADGAVRVYDAGLRLVAWFEDLSAGPITSISFAAPGASLSEAPRLGGSSASVASTTSLTPPLRLRDFIVATSRALVIGCQASLFAELSPDARRGTLLLQGLDDGVYGLAAHPLHNRFLVGTRGGTLQLWDADSRALLLVRLLQEEAEEAESARLRALHQARDAGRKFHPDEFALTSIAWHPTGAVVAVAVGGGPGMNRGASVRFLDADTLGDMQEPLGRCHKARRGGGVGSGDGTSSSSTTAGGAGGGGGGGGGSGGAGSTGAAGKPGAGTGRLGSPSRTSKEESKDGLDDGNVLGEGGPGGAATLLRFSHCGRWLASADDGRYVCLWHFARTTVRANADRKEWELEDGESEEVREEDRWVYVGRARSHSAPITGLEWTVDPADGSPRLLSVGEDRRAVEYDVLASSITAGLVVLQPRVRLEQSAVPTTCTWLPPGSLPGSSELLLATANDEFKLKLWNATNKACRRTVLAPTYGGPLTRFVLLPSTSASGSSSTSAAGGGDGKVESSGLAAYATADRVVGLTLLPLDGNPNRSVGVVAHPREVTNVVPSADGRTLITTGGEDGTVVLWRVDRLALEEVASAGGTGLAPFLAMLPGGADGTFYQEICDFFAYAQIRSQGEDSTLPRRAGITLPLKELTSLMRALSFYPTEAESEALCNEVRYGSFSESGQKVEEVDLGTVIRLFVNHRPVLGVGRPAIADALAVLARAHGSLGGGRGAGIAATGRRRSGDAGGSGMDASLPWTQLSAALRTLGEPLADADIADCLNALTGTKSIPGHEDVDAARLAYDILGFVEQDK